jgi:HAD superfamily, subfamily IIIB (Acid phosphatase)
MLTVVGRYENPEHAVKDTMKTLSYVTYAASPSLIKSRGKSITVSKQHLGTPLIVFDIDDTLLREDNTPISEVVTLLHRLKSLKAKIFLVTARHPSIRDQTILELQDIGILPSHYEELLLCPEKYRTSMKLVGEWKRSARQRIANKYQVPILLTVGDQWTDLVSVKSLKELQQLDVAHGSEHTPWMLFRVEDGIGFFGLKLKAS